MKIPNLFLAIFAFLCGHASAQDIVIYGGTPGGIAAAVSAARMGWLLRAGSFQALEGHDTQTSMAWNSRINYK